MQQEICLLKMNAVSLNKSPVRIQKADTNAKLCGALAEAPPPHWLKEWTFKGRSSKIKIQNHLNNHNHGQVERYASPWQDTRSQETFKLLPWSVKIYWGCQSAARDQHTASSSSEQYFKHFLCYREVQWCAAMLETRGWKVKFRSLIFSDSLANLTKAKPS